MSWASWDPQTCCATFTSNSSRKRETQISAWPVTRLWMTQSWSTDVEVFSSPKSAWFNIGLLPTLQIQEEHCKMERQHYKIHQHFQKKWLSCLLILFHTHTQTWQNIAIIHPMSSRCFPWYFSYFSPSQAAEVTASLSGRLIMALRDCTSKTWLSQTGMFTVTNTWYMSNDIYICIYVYMYIYIYIFRVMMCQGIYSILIIIKVAWWLTII